MQNTTTIKFKKLAIWDIVILGIIYLVPSLSHLFSIQLYLLDPMRIVLLGSLLFFRDYKNAYFLAFTLPLFSFIVGGHPIFLKSLLISFELFTNVGLLVVFINKGKTTFIKILLSIIISKLLYYVVKYVVIVTGLWETQLVSTALWAQLFVAIVISFSFVVIERRRV